MYGWSRIDDGFRDEVDKFIEAAEKHALTLTHYKRRILFQPPLEILFVRGAGSPAALTNSISKNG